MRTKTKQKAIDWFISLGKTKREELSLEYYGTDLLLDDDILEMYLEEVPHYSEQDIIEAFDLGMDFRMKRLNGNFKITVDEVLNNFFAEKLKK